MDVLSQILDSVHLRSSIYYATEFRSPWGLRVPADRNVCRFHVVVEGGMHLTVSGEEVQVSRGDLVLVPHGRAHSMRDDPDTDLTRLEEAMEVRAPSAEGLFRWGEGRDVACRLVCGHFAFDKEAAHPLLDALPPVVHVRATPTYNFRWIDQVMQFIGEEANSSRPGSEVIARRLSEVLFVQVIRHYAESTSDPVPILSGITDPRLSRALHAMHSHLDRAWTVAQLAREAGMSRTAFTLRFAELIGSSPMKYLTDLRMREAARMLRSGEAVAITADRVGYQSEAAFARKFKDFAGIGPGGYRRQRAVTIS